MSEVGLTAAEALLSDEKTWIDDVEQRLETVEGKVNGLNNLEEMYSDVNLFILNNSMNMQPVTFGDLKTKNVTWAMLKYGYVKFYAFRFWRFEGGTL